MVFFFIFALVFRCNTDYAPKGCIGVPFHGFFCGLRFYPLSVHHLARSMFSLLPAIAVKLHFWGEGGGELPAESDVAPSTQWNG